MSDVASTDPEVNVPPGSKYDPREDRDAQAFARNLVGDAVDRDPLEEFEERHRRDRNITRIPDTETDERLHFSQGTTRFCDKRSDFFPSRYYTQKAVDSEIWPNYFGQRHETRDHKKNGPWITQGLFERLDDRRATNARVNYFLIFDIDDGATFDEVVAIVRARQIPCVVTTTWSHQQRKSGMTCDRMRVIIPLRSPFNFLGLSLRELGVECSRPLDVSWIKGHSVWPRMYLDIAKDLGLKVDETCKDPSRLFYLPACPIGSEHLARRCIVGVNAKWPYFDWKPYAGPAIKAELERLAKIEERRQMAAFMREAPDEDDARDVDAEIKEIEAALAKIEPDLEYGKWRDVIFALHNGYGSGPRADAMLDRIITWSASGEKFGDSTEEQITRMWESADPDGATTMGTFWLVAKQHDHHRRAKSGDAISRSHMAALRRQFTPPKRRTK